MSSDLPVVSDVRAHVVSILEPLVPAWDVKPGIVTPATIAKPTLYVEYHTIEPLPEAPIGSVRCTFNLTIVDHHTDLARAEDGIDAGVLDLVQALDERADLTWTTASKTADFAPNLGWTLTVAVLASIPTPTTDPAPVPDPTPEPEE